MTGIEMVHVPYRGGAPMIADLLAGQVEVGIDVMTTALPHIRSGALRALGVGGKSDFRAAGRARPSAKPLPGTRRIPGAGSACRRARQRHHREAQPRDQCGSCRPDAEARLVNVATTPIFFSPAEFGAYVAAEDREMGQGDQNGWREVGMIEWA